MPGVFVCLDGEVEAVGMLMKRSEPFVMLGIRDGTGAIQQTRKLRIIGPCPRLLKVAALKWA